MIRTLSVYRSQAVPHTAGAIEAKLHMFESYFHFAAVWAFGGALSSDKASRYRKLAARTNTTTNTHTNTQTDQSYSPTMGWREHPK